MRNLKKVIALVAVFAMLVTSVAFAQTYSDVKADDNYAEAIEMLSNLEILTGDDEDGDGVMDFRPNDTITRAEVAAIVCRIQNMNSLAQTGTQFNDVTSANWASGYIAQAAGQGIINGNGDGTFNPEGNVKYEEAVKMFVRTLGYEPYVNGNGGYPSGDLAAANRWGILNNVVGGSTGVDATRGQIAQMAFNALEAPMMDRYSYGTEENYQVYDGKGGRDFMTLLTRDFSIKKFSGIVTENQVTTLDAAKDIDTDKEATVDFIYNENDDYVNYDVNEDDTVYIADSNIGDYLGYEVNVYVRETNRGGSYNVIAAAPTSTNKVASFTIDQFSSASNTEIKYYKDGANSTSTYKIDSNGYDIIYNGVAYDADDDDTLGEILSNLGVESESAWSGQVTLIDNNATTGYDVVIVEVNAPAVVDEVAGDLVNFKETAVTSANESVNALDFDADVTDTIVKLTKNGEAINYEDLKEWDVLAVLYNGANEYYDVRVIDSNNIDGAIESRKDSKTSNGDKAYKIGGDFYDVAENCYGYKSGGWNVGTAGMFYIDAYGKIVAFDKNGSTTVSSTSGKYGYILNASSASNGFDETVRVQVLDKSGQVYTADLATKVKVENGEGTFATEDQYEVKANADDFIEALMNQLITYEANNAGEIKTVTFPVDADSDDAENEFNVLNKANAVATNVEFDGEEMAFDNYIEVTEDTLVFFVKGAESAITGLGDQDNAGDKTSSKVSKATSLSDGEIYGKIAFFDVVDDVAGAVVVFNQTGGVSSSTNIAVIDEVGTTKDDDNNTVSYVKFFMNGEMMEARTDYYLEEDGLEIEEATRGAVYKLEVNDGVITEATYYASLSRNVATGKEEFETPAQVDINEGKLTALNTVEGKEAMYFGAVTDYDSSSKKIKIATATKAGVPDFTSIKSIKAADANVYVIDESKKSNKVYVGIPSNASYNDDLVDRAKDSNAGDVNISKPSVETIASGKGAEGLMDYVFAVEYDNDIIDIVIYKPLNEYKVKSITAAK